MHIRKLHGDVLCLIVMCKKVIWSGFRASEFEDCKARWGNSLICFHEDKEEWQKMRCVYFSFSVWERIRNAILNSAWTPGGSPAFLLETNVSPHHRRCDGRVWCPQTSLGLFILRTPSILPAPDGPFLMTWTTPGPGSVALYSRPWAEGPPSDQTSLTGILLYANIASKSRRWCRIGSVQSSMTCIESVNHLR